MAGALPLFLLRGERERQVATVEDIVCRSGRFIPGGVNSSLRVVGFPLVIARAEGSSFWDADGKEYCDYHGAFGPVLLGHRHPEVDARVKETMDRLDLVGTGVT